MTTTISAHGTPARQLLHQQSVGVLSTHSVDLEGYPFGSIAPYILNYEGEPAILISDIAQHTRNIKQDKRVSLTVFDRFASDAQAACRLTWMGPAVAADPGDGALRDRYLRYFPSAVTYFDTHDFAFYLLRLVKARFIGGFGQIYWLEPDALLRSNPFHDTERRILQHMNEDHQPALLHYCEALKGIKAESVAMTGIDSEGFDLLADGRRLRFEFESPVHSLDEARATLAKLARR